MVSFCTIERGTYVYFSLFKIFATFENRSCLLLAAYFSIII